MIRINLIPFRAARSKEIIKRQITMFCLSIVALVVLLFAVSLVLGNKVSNKRDEVEKIKKEVAKYEAINKEIREIKSVLNLLEKRTEVINRLEKDRRAPVQMMELFTDLIIKDRMWFTAIETDTKQPVPPKQAGKGKKGKAKATPKKGKDKGKDKDGKDDEPDKPVVLPPPTVTIKISGMAVDNQTVADFMTLLEGATTPSDDGKSKDVVFASVKLNKLQQEYLRDNIYLKKFDITLVKSTPKVTVMKNKRMQKNG
jgi:type IV pilus assembly protein PilN